MFKWVCLILAVLAVLGLGWVINDLRIELKQTSQTVNEHLGEILLNVKKSTETLAILSEDIKQLRDLAGVASGTPRDRTLVAYADSILDFIESTDAQIGLEKKIIGSGLKSLMPAQEWVVDARKEALWLTFRAKSRNELLERLCKNKFGSSWFIEFEAKEPLPLLDWLKENHPETKENGTENL